MTKCRLNKGMIIIFIIIVPFSFLYASGNIIQNKVSAPYSVTLKQINEVVLPGSPIDIYINDDYAYVLCPSVVILNINDPNNIPKPVVYTDLANNANSIAFNGSFAYIGQNDGIIKIVDFKTKNTPQSRGSIDAFGEISKVFIYKGYLYFIRRNFGLNVYDISIPDVPISRGTQVVTGEANSLFVKDHYAYVTSVNGNLTIIDISDISKLPIAGTYNFGINFYDVFVNENYAYVPQGETGVQVINVSKPLTPTHITNIFSRKFAKQVVVEGYYTWVNDDNSIQAFYSREPKDQLYAGSFSNYNGTINKIAVVDNKYIYLCSSDLKLKIIQVYYNY
jgi:hypothetical protein